MTVQSVTEFATPRKHLAFVTSRGLRRAMQPWDREFSFTGCCLRNNSKPFLFRACKDCRWGNHTDCFHPQCITADGMERPVVSLNRKIPGPGITVCRNDIIVIDLKNHMEGSAASIHWHGMHQMQTPWMDGVPMVTQCPIPPGDSFRYIFNASEHGTQFYHSHAGHQKANGHFGLLIVRHPNDLNKNLYDYDLTEHNIIIADWTLDMAEKFVPGLQSHTIQIDSILINGRGRHFDVSK